MKCAYKLTAIQKRDLLEYLHDQKAYLFGALTISSDSEEKVYIRSDLDCVSLLTDIVVECEESIVT